MILLQSHMFFSTGNNNTDINNVYGTESVFLSNIDIFSRFQSVELKTVHE